MQVASIIDIAKMVGASRILRGYGLTSPLSDYHLDKESEKRQRRRFVEKAFDMLQQPGQKDHYETI